MVASATPPRLHCSVVWLRFQPWLLHHSLARACLAAPPLAADAVLVEGCWLTLLLLERAAWGGWAADAADEDGRAAGMAPGCVETAAAAA